MSDIGGTSCGLVQTGFAAQHLADATNRQARKEWVMQLRWPDLETGRADQADGTAVEIAGWMATAASATHFLLSPEPSCCVGCAPRDPHFAVAVFADAPIVAQPQALRLAGT